MGRTNGQPPFQLASYPLMPSTQTLSQSLINYNLTLHIRYNVFLLCQWGQPASTSRHSNPFCLLLINLMIIVLNMNYLIAFGSRLFVETRSIVVRAGVRQAVLGSSPACGERARAGGRGRTAGRSGASQPRVRVRVSVRQAVLITTRTCFKKHTYKPSYGKYEQSNYLKNDFKQT